MDLTRLKKQHSFFKLTEQNIELRVEKKSYWQGPKTVIKIRTSFDTKLYESTIDEKIIIVDHRS